MHLAGFKLRRWRETHDPPLSADQFGARYGLPNPWPSRTVYGWEAKGKIARASVQKRLAELGVAIRTGRTAPASGYPTRCPARMSGSDTHSFYDLHTHGFVRVATSTPKARRISRIMRQAFWRLPARPRAACRRAALSRTRAFFLCHRRFASADGPARCGRSGNRRIVEVSRSSPCWCSARRCGAMAGSTIARSS